MAHQRLDHVLQIDYYASVPSIRYERELETALKNLSHNSYDELERSWALVPWRTLCRQHDRQQPSSLLRLLCHKLQNPTLYPQAAILPLARVVVDRVLLMGTSAALYRNLRAWPTSHQFWLAFLNARLRTSPALQVALLASLTVPKHLPGLYRMLSLVKCWLQLFPERSTLLLPHLVDLVARLDVLLEDVVPEQVSLQRINKNGFDVDAWHDDELCQQPIIVRSPVQSNLDSILVLLEKTWRLLFASSDQWRTVVALISGVERHGCSPTIGILAVILAEPYGIDQFLELLWKRAMESSECMRFYVNVLAECSSCDAQQVLWDATRPILLFLLHRSGLEDPSGCVGAALRSMAFLMTRRGRILARVSEFSALVAQLSVHYKDPIDWVADKESSAKEIQALREAGILGLCDQVTPSTTNKPPSARLWFGLWRLPFLHNRKYLLSAISLTNGVKKAGPTEAYDSPAIMNYLFDDNLLHVFQYLSYRDLGRVRRVCHTWKTIASTNSLWQQTYKSRYGFEAGDLAAQNTQLDWKAAYQERVLAERELRITRRSSTNFRPIVCRYVGCGLKLTTEKRKDQHYAMHARKTARHEAAAAKRRARSTKNRKKRQSPPSSSSRRSVATNKRAKLPPSTQPSVVHLEL